MIGTRGRRAAGPLRRRRRFFFFHDPAPTAIYTLSLHDALPIFGRGPLGIIAAIVLCTDPDLLPIVGMETTFYVAVLFTVLTLFEAGRLEATALLLGLVPVVRQIGRAHV